MPLKLCGHRYKSNLIQWNLNMAIRICSNLKPETQWGDVGCRKTIITKDIRWH